MSSGGQKSSYSSAVWHYGALILHWRTASVVSQRLILSQLEVRAGFRLVPHRVEGYTRPCSFLVEVRAYAIGGQRGTRRRRRCNSRIRSMQTGRENVAEGIAELIDAKVDQSSTRQS